MTTSLSRVSPPLDLARRHVVSVRAAYGMSGRLSGGVDRVADGQARRPPKIGIQVPMVAPPFRPMLTGGQSKTQDRRQRSTTKAVWFVG